MRTASTQQPCWQRPSVSRGRRLSNLASLAGTVSWRWTGQLFLPAAVFAHATVERCSTMSEISQARQALVEQILNGNGRASYAQRRGAFDNARLTQPLATLVEKVARHASKVADEDFTVALDAGLSEDQIFEIVVCAAIGQATREYDAALAALNVATGRE
jgi:hypothetical protein